MILSDPRIFNYLAIALFALAALRWACEGRWVDAAYWGCGALLNAIVTWGYQ